MDLPKFLSLLSSSALYLSRLDNLIDSHEGTWPSSTLDAAAQNWPAENFESFMQTSDAMRAAHFVNCWSASQHESSIMWGSYAAQTGIAICSTIGSLKASVKPEFRFYIGEVQYVDFKNAPLFELNLFRPVYIKRIEYEAENEVRLLVSVLGSEQSNPSVSGARESVQLNVHLDRLIERVVLAPNSPLYLHLAVRDLLHQYGLSNITVDSSQL